MSFLINFMKLQVRASSVVQFPGIAALGASGLIMSPAISLWMVPPTIRREGVIEDGGLSIYGSTLTNSYLAPQTSYPSNLNNVSEDTLNKKE